MNKEELRAYLDKKYPTLIQDIQPSRQLTVHDIVLTVETRWCIDEQEGSGCIEDRLLSALEDAKKLLEHDIAKIKGEQI